MKNNILLIGMGNLGKRYLEAILKLKQVKHIYLFDKNKNIIRQSKIFYFYNKKIIVLNNLDSLKLKNFKLCIVATVSKKRLELIKFLERKFIIKNYIIEKILEQNNRKIVGIKQALESKSNFSWVNLPYKSMKFFKIARKKINEKVNKIIIKSSNLDLASNIVHYIYWYSFILNSKFEKLYIKKKSYFEKSKRKNFKEMFGEISIYFINGSKLILKSNKTKQTLSINHKIYNKKDQIILFMDEIEGVIKNKEEIIYQKIEYLSDYMCLIIKNILKKNECSLPKLSDVYLDHATIVQSFLYFYNKKYNTNLKNLYIT